MSAATFMLALTLAAGAPVAPAPAPAGFCTILEGIIAAEDQPSPFASLVMPARYGNMEWSRLVTPGFDHCVVMWIERGRAVSCSRTMAPPDLTANNLALETAACLGQAPTPSVWGPDTREMVFEYEAVRIVIEEDCDDRCHVGRRVSYTVEARRRP